MRENYEEHFCCCGAPRIMTSPMFQKRDSITEGVNEPYLMPSITATHPEMHGLQRSCGLQYAAAALRFKRIKLESCQHLFGKKKVIEHLQRGLVWKPDRIGFGWDTCICRIT